MNTNISIFPKGERKKESIIFVHGFPYDHTMWDEVTAGLSGNYYCVTYDIRGLGKSDAGDGQFTMDMFSDDLFEVIEKENLEKPVLCGLSMGGYISLRAVERNQGKFSGLILCDTKSEADTNQNKIKRAQAVKIINNKGLETFMNEFIPTCFAKESIDRLGKKYEDVFNRSMQFNPLGVKGCLLAMAGRTDTTEFLPEINIPALVLCGEKDTLSTPDNMKKMASEIKGSKFVLIKDSGHMTPIEQPQAVLNEIKEFLKTLK